MIVKRVGVRSVAQLAAAIYGVWGLIVGVIFSLAALVGFGISEEVGRSASWLGPLFGIGAIIAMPVIYFLMGYVIGLVGGWVFNNAAETMGGLEVELVESA